MDPLSRSALTEKHGKHDGFPCPPERLASGNCRGKTSDTKRQRRQRSKCKDLLFSRWPIAGKFWNATDRCYRLIFGKPGSEAWNSDCKSSAARKNESFFCVSADCSYRMQSHVLDSSSGKRNAAAVSAKDSSPPWHMSYTHSANICG